MGMICRAPTSSLPPGVRKMSNEKYQATVWKKKPWYLGTYPTIEEAADTVRKAKAACKRLSGSELVKYIENVRDPPGTWSSHRKNVFANPPRIFRKSTKHGERFDVRMRLQGKTIALGNFSTREQANQQVETLTVAYKRGRESLLECVRSIQAGMQTHTPRHKGPKRMSEYLAKYDYLAKFNIPMNPPPKRRRVKSPKNKSEPESSAVEIKIEPEPESPEIKLENVSYENNITFKIEPAGTD